ncbi:hypothetical protein A2154_03940 [Candidatus Gottesmanbacteria bacterium RBG_16_43_7]|uniref:Uncharacterized protein n=1 Tax=Candidatus Gottesmanbacteria bacterium RBG_16_43_7 TaxID=1798373 RepID=A0A1F5Z8N3_9BACT|nr:MAG: hypothetical protein A2154_03940 [Candidatus Gottesmanbacteria bacterium RBG_16_43_7]
MTHSPLAPHIRRVQSLLSLSMILTMIAALFMIAAAPYSPWCRISKVTAKKSVTDRFFYTLSDNRSLWSKAEFSVGDRVCLE